MKTELNPEVFRLAAEYVMVFEECACVSLRYACTELGVSYHLYRSFFSERFWPRNVSCEELWWPRFLGPTWNENPRVIALLLCAEMLEGGAK